MLNKILIVPRSIKGTLIFALFLTIMLSILISFFEVNTYNDYFPTNILYLESITPSIEEYLKESDIDYCQTRVLNIEGSNKSSIIEKEKYELKERIYLNEITYNKETTNLTKVENKKLRKKNSVVNSVSVEYLFDCNLREKINILESTNGPTILVKGSYPSKENEVMISENYALKLISENENYSKYEDIIGNTINISTSNQYTDEYSYKNKELKVTGIYAGGNNLITIPPKDEELDLIKNGNGLNDAIYIEFPSNSEKEEFIDEYVISSNIKYLSSNNTNKINFSIIYKLLFASIIILIDYLILFKKMNELLRILNYHVYSKLNIIWIYSWYLLLILIVLFSIIV